MKIADRFEFRTKDPVLTFAPGDMVIDAVRAMSEKNYGAGIVVDPARRPVGIITERDFMRRLLAKSLDPKDEITQRAVELQKAIGVVTTSAVAKAEAKNKRRQVE